MQKDFPSLCRKLCSLAAVALVASAAGSSLRAQASPSPQRLVPGFYNMGNGRQMLVMPPFMDPKDISSNSEENDSSKVADVLALASCYDRSAVDRILKSSLDYQAGLRALEAMAANTPRCASAKRYMGTTRSVELVAPVDSASWAARSGKQLAINTAPFLRGGWRGNLDTLAKQAEDSVFLNHLRMFGGLDNVQFQAVVKQLRSKQCLAGPLPDGSFLARNYGVGIQGRNRKYVRQSGDPETIVAQCELPGGGFVDMSERCDNVYGLAQAVVYVIEPPAAESPVAILPPAVEQEQIAPPAPLPPAFVPPRDTTHVVKQVKVVERHGGGGGIIIGAVAVVGIVAVVALASKGHNEANATNTTIINNPQQPTNPDTAAKPKGGGPINRPRIGHIGETISAQYVPAEVPTFMSAVGLEPIAVQPTMVAGKRGTKFGISWHVNVPLVSISLYDGKFRLPLVTRQQ